MSERDARAVALDYFARVRAGREDIADLFHADAELLGLGRRVSGRDAIRSFYQEAVTGPRPSPSEPVSLLGDANRAFAEIYIGLADGTTIHAVDVFAVDGGLVRSLTYFIAEYPGDSV